MLGAEGFFPDREGPLIEGLGFGVVAEVLVETGQISETGSDARMLGAEGFLVDREAAAVERLGFRVVAAGLVEPGQVVEAEGHVGVVRAEGFFADGEGLLGDRGWPRCSRQGCGRPPQGCSG